MPRIKNKEKKEMEYADAPSGFVTLYNYKEPFMKYERGFGFEGVLLFDGETDKVQCHLCGGWYTALPNHIRAEHNMLIPAYKYEVGLGTNTALIGEKLRAKLIAGGLDKRLANLRTQGRKTPEVIEKIRKGLKKYHASREAQNVSGTCPEQLVDRLIKEYQKAGKTPAQKSISFEQPLLATYGTYRNACRIAGIPEPRTVQDVLVIGRQTMIKRSQEKVEKFFEWIAESYKKTGKFPSFGVLRKKEFRDHFSIFVYYKGKPFYLKRCKEIAVQYCKFTENLKGFKFSKEELIDFLRGFEDHHGRKPSYSDAKRRLIPHLSNYSYHFGSWNKALKVAFPVK